MGIVGDIKNLKKAVKKIPRLPGEIKDDIDRNLVRPVRDRANKAHDRLDWWAVRIKELQKQAKQLDDIVESAAEAAAKKVIAEITSEASQEVLKTMLSVVRVAAPSSVSFDLGPISLSIDDIHDRIDQLEHYAEHGIPSNREGIKKAILDFAPSSLSVSLSINVALVVANIDELGVGMSCSWDAEDIVENIDDVLECLGI